MKKLTAVCATGMLALTVLLLAPGTTQAEGTTCGSETVYIPDGRILRSTIPDATTFWFLVQIQSDRSYTVEVHFDTSTQNAPAPTVTVRQDTDGCGASTLVTADRRFTEPVMRSGGSRLSFVTTNNPPGPLRISIQNDTGATQTYTLVVNETTLFSTAWSTIGTYDSFYSLYNTTNSTCHGTLRLFTTAGSTVTEAPVTIGSWATVSTNTRALGTPRDSGGTATFTHDCPAGGVLAEAAIANFTITPTPYFQGVKFQPTRESMH
jgi:hypothetical protein